jgi:DNA-binding LacI/PurR family transcriptional regulator
MNDLRERLRSVMVKEAKSDRDCAQMLGISSITFKSYLYNPEHKVSAKTLRRVERYINEKELNAN